MSTELLFKDLDNTEIFFLVIAGIEKGVISAAETVALLEVLLLSLQDKQPSETEEKETA